MKTLHSLAPAILVPLLLSSGASAAVVYQQGVADTHVAFEAENYDSLVENTTTGFVVISKATPFTSAFGTVILDNSSNASGGAALLDDFRVGGNGDHSSTVSYKMTFATAGTYRLYIRQSVFEDNNITANYGNEDSIFLPAGFGLSANTITPLNASSTFQEGQYNWYSGASFTVAPGDVGNTLTFNIDDRESGTSLDRFVFSTSTSLNAAALDALANSSLVPEPSSALLGLLSSALLLRRKRH